MRPGCARELLFISDENLVFLDETGVNLHQSCNYGYSPKNVKGTKMIKASRGTNRSCIVGIKKSGTIAFEVKDGPFDGNNLFSFITNKLKHIFRMIIMTY